MCTKLTLCVSSQALADTKFSSEKYNDVNDLLTKVKNDNSVSKGLTVGVSSTRNPVMVTIGVSTSQDASFLKKLSKYNEKVLKHNAHVAHYPIIYAEHVLPNCIKKYSSN